MGAIPKSMEKACAEPEAAVGWVTPLSALEFANRLSDLEGLDRCYDIVGGTGPAETGERLDPWFVTSITTCTGYRLPMPSEWLALLDSEPLLEDRSQRGNIAWVSERWGSPRVARKWPSYYGLYDIAGDMQELGFLPGEPERQTEDLPPWRDVEEQRICLFACHNDRLVPCREGFGLRGFFPYWGRIASVGLRLVRSY